MAEITEKTTPIEKETITLLDPLEKLCDRQETN
jgi:hypothetical protein